MVTLAVTDFDFRSEFPREFNRQQRRMNLAWRLGRCCSCEYENHYAAPMPPENPTVEDLYNYMFSSEWQRCCRLITGIAELEPQMLSPAQARRNNENAQSLVVGKTYLASSPIRACGYPAISVIETFPQNMHFSEVRYLGSFKGHNFFEGVPDNDDRPMTQGCEYLGRCYFSILLIGGPVLAP